MWVEQKVEKWFTRSPCTWPQWWSLFWQIACSYESLKVSRMTLMNLQKSRKWSEINVHQIFWQEWWFSLFTLKSFCFDFKRTSFVYKALKVSNLNSNNTYIFQNASPISWKLCVLDLIERQAISKFICLKGAHWLITSFADLHLGTIQMGIVWSKEGLLWCEEKEEKLQTKMKIVMKTRTWDSQHTEQKAKKV